MLTVEQFKNINPGEKFASGVLPDDPSGINMTNSGKNLRWVAIKGYGDDWCIYTFWAIYDEEYISKHGDKVIMKDNIKKCVPCTEEVFKKYRY